MKNRIMLKTGIIFIILLFFAITTSYANGAGRYQLFQGEYKFVNLKGEEVWSKALLKIDTMTGEVWIGDQWQLIDNKGKETQKRAWRPFEEEIYISGPSKKK
jgi:hypothetical protein